MILPCLRSRPFSLQMRQTNAAAEKRPSVGVSCVIGPLCIVELLQLGPVCCQHSGRPIIYTFIYVSCLFT